MATYGEIRLRLSKLLPGIDAELIDGWIGDRYAQILDELPWKRLEAEGRLQSPASYAEGTIAVTQGSAAVVGTGTTFTSAMTGRMIRINNRNEFYQFTFVDATNGTLDRGYEGTDDALASYRIDQNVYLLPSDLRYLKGIRRLEVPGIIDIIPLSELNRISPTRSTYGDPLYAAVYMDSFSDPPLPQLELYPVPETLAAYPFEYVYDPAVADPTQTALSVLPWVRPACLIEGVQANGAAKMRDFTATEYYEARFAKLLSQMITTDAYRRGPQRMKMAGWMTDHERQRWSR